MEEKDAQDAKSGINVEQSLMKEISVQYAIISSATKLINQLRQEKKINNNSNTSSKPSMAMWWVYNMDGLEHWIHHYTQRRRLHCPKCKAETTFSCETCNETYEYHDEL